MNHNIKKVQFINYHKLLVRMYQKYYKWNTLFHYAININNKYNIYKQSLPNYIV